MLEAMAREGGAWAEQSAKERCTAEEVRLPPAGESVAARSGEKAGTEKGEGREGGEGDRASLEGTAAASFAAGAIPEEGRQRRGKGEGAVEVDRDKEREG